MFASFVHIKAQLDPCSQFLFIKRRFKTVNRDIRNELAIIIWILAEHVLLVKFACYVWHWHHLYIQ